MLGEEAGWRSERLMYKPLALTVLVCTAAKSEPEGGRKRRAGGTRTGGAHLGHGLGAHALRRGTRSGHGLGVRTRRRHSPSRSGFRRHCSQPALLDAEKLADSPAIARISEVARHSAQVSPSSAKFDGTWSDHLQAELGCQMVQVDQIWP